MRFAVAFLLLLSACSVDVYTPERPTAEQVDAVDAALWVWQGELGAVPACWAERDRLRWRVLDRDGVDLVCGGVDTYDGCHVPIDGAPEIVVLDTPSESWRRTIEAHELAHWLQHCSGRVPEGDPTHSDAAVWPRLVNETLAAMR
ncbi:MAG TPA: hypothetical protein VHM19_23230 [Polyangiales bacterium]|nr:hypothetical protein [Polyangiales bacterium]